MSPQRFNKISHKETSVNNKKVKFLNKWNNKWWTMSVESVRKEYREVCKTLRNTQRNSQNLREKHLDELATCIDHLTRNTHKRLFQRIQNTENEINVSYTQVKIEEKKYRSIGTYSK